MKYETVIGLEVHVQIDTKTKIFCSCSTQFGTPANENTCPICLGMPGVLPVLNKRFLESSMRACLATHCTIEPMNRFARKNYFYPDLPKGYQISQFELPLGTCGHININVDGTKKRIGLTRIHMEEDAGKLIHGENLGNPGKSYVDFNRTGVPLCEVVSEPDMRSAEEARAYLLELKSILEYTEVSDCNMEEGSFRCDANVSIRPIGLKEFGTRTELKNLNSFKFIQKAIEYEVDRQTNILDQGDTVKQETRLYDADRGETFPMRSKEEAHDYRYFPDPDLVPIIIDEAWVEELQKTIPELPEQKRERFVSSYGIPEYDTGVLTSSKLLADYFEQCASLFPQPKIISNWIMGDLLRELKKDGKDIADCPISPSALVDLLKLIDSGTISGNIAKGVFEEMYQTKKPADSIVEEKGLKQITDSSAIEKIVDEVIQANPSQVEEFKGGKEKVIGFLVGQVMKQSKGKANPGMVNKLLKEKMS
ncbi:MAG: Asp-tRNA(Asn)/Glu-tRNA(Gln) amidotransferase subunit GatB [Nitrospina sp.]|jgi:aspartyl-tRNA(Asn)/glutamyl-tRNA(Gln) amidotransferase subunit B|nr:Asp-tRNA(Asn)/Glu-tRNA(Gln) amidotransferase subunit GatB [Nitrospina sp.]MBT3509790.1 Asp-tRNA(Asn)/Glu-tRNA(Gln) amidotransferase subunit GatB [Nitrospina sp.]MBT3874889.1 Asp-tRNA(Asn)/Glu-tRNA(Gln) amidotransferase subunit GatB [Nitrospina sp.]MBT4049788.1 Asp-tRNA(Asn)/Glu-tRNA(Gln) amidotransferase subunit GatB [Nitrospina sp.]MBT4558730.1 Asp-tRNA(Asn)/Glu-tRNA(Gln) amidotransferase subunit GatB [Nitrospina sp.]